MDLYSQGYERSYTVNSSILNAIEPHIKDFQQLLLDPPKVKPQSSAKRSITHPKHKSLDTVYILIDFWTSDL